MKNYGIIPIFVPTFYKKYKFDFVELKVRTLNLLEVKEVGQGGVL